MGMTHVSVSNQRTAVWAGPRESDLSSVTWPKSSGRGLPAHDETWPIAVAGSVPGSITGGANLSASAPGSLLSSHTSAWLMRGSVSSLTSLPSM